MPVLVRLMGAFSVEVDSRIVDHSRFQRRSAAAVVKLLASAPTRRMHREQIIDALWPGTLPAGADPDPGRTRRASPRRQTRGLHRRAGIGREGPRQHRLIVTDSANEDSYVLI